MFEKSFLYFFFLFGWSHLGSR